MKAAAEQCYREKSSLHVQQNLGTKYVPRSLLPQWSAEPMGFTSQHLLQGSISVWDVGNGPYPPTLGVEEAGH